MTRTFGPLTVSVIALAAAATPASARERRISPYIEVGQVLTADTVTNDILTYSEASVGVDAAIQGRRTRITVSYRYDRRFAWDKQIADNDSHTGLARGSVAVGHGLSIDGGAVATRARTDFRGASSQLNIANSANTSQIYSGDVGPSFAGRLGPIGISTAYRYGYTKAESPSIPAAIAGQRRSVFDTSQRHLVQGSAGVKAGSILPVGLSVGGAYEREDAGQLDGRYEGAYGRGDVVAPVTSTIALVAGAGYEKIEITQKDAVVNGAGIPVLNADGRYITNSNSPRRLAYDTEGVFWDAGVVYRPNPRLTAQARAGRRYDSMTYTGSLSYQASTGLGVNIGVYDGIQSFGRQLRGGLASLPTNFETANDPFGQSYGGCVYGGGGSSAGACLSPALQSLSSLNYRARGIDGVIVHSRGRSSMGIGAGYTNRKYLTPNGGPNLAFANGTEDQSAYAQFFMSQSLDSVSSIAANINANWGSSNAPGATDVYTAGASGSYTRRFGPIGATASFGIYGYDSKFTELQYQSLARIGLRYGF